MWKRNRSLSPERLREAAYTLTTYLESKEPGIEFDPPSPFSTRRAHLQRRTSLSDRVVSNFNRKESGRPSSSEPSSCPDLSDVEDAPKPLTILELGSGTGIIIAKLAEILSDRDANDVPVGWFQISLSSCLLNPHTDGVLIATDLGNVCPLLDENLLASANRSGRIDHPGPRILVRPLEWGNPSHTLKIFSELGSRSLTHIICSDLVSFHHHK